MNDFEIFKKIINLKIKQKDNSQKIEDEKEDNLKNNLSFCMAPWIHFKVYPNGDVQPCSHIINNKNTMLGNVNENSLEEIWNSETAKNIRLKMLNGEKIRECFGCYNTERDFKKTSQRQNFNKKYFSKYEDIVKQTREDGTVDKINMVYFDFRFSNKCNFTCRTCGPHYSSSWEKKINYINPKIKNVKNIIEKTKELILNNNLDEIYFGGGEPLIIDEHWEIIDYLIEHKKFDIIIKYNTNLSVLRYKKNDFIEKLKLFNNVTVSPSCDSLGIRGEYIRTGFSSQTFIKNINILKKNNFNYFITSVLSFYNIFYIYDFFLDLKENNINYNNINFNLLTEGYDYYFSVYNLPKEMINETLENIDKLATSDFLNEEKKEYFKELIISIKKNNVFNEKKFKKTIDYIKYLDSFNKLQFKDCFPELYEKIFFYF